MGGQATTLSIDRVLFKEPIRTGEFVEMRARVVLVGRTSMSIRVDVTRFQSRAAAAELARRIVMEAVHPRVTPLGENKLRWLPGTKAGS